MSAVGMMLVIFDVPPLLTPEMYNAGFKPHGRLLHAWSRALDPASPEARDIEYEANGVGLKTKWWTPPDRPGGHSRRREPPAP